MIARMTYPQKPIPKEVRKKLEVSSVHLVRLGAESLPGEIASGLLIDYNGSRHLCTVAHALKDGPISLQIEWNPALRTTSTRLLNLMPIVSKQITCPSAIEDKAWAELDFAYCKISFPEIPLYQELDNETLSGKIRSSQPCKIYKETEIADPNLDVEYGFFGQTQPKYEEHQILPDDVKYFGTALQPCYPLKFIGEDGDFYVFRLPEPHPGHKYFEGCSGAPIVDTDGNVVALLCKGNIDQSIIYGFPIKKFEIVLRISASGLLDQIPGI